MMLDLSATTAALQGMVTDFFYLLPYLVIAVIVYGIFHVVARYAGRGVTYVFSRRSRHKSLGVVLGRLTQGGLMLVGVLVALVVAIPSFKPAQLVQLLGISGVAFGFAFRDILQNFLAGILILLTEPFRIGDQIVVGKFEGTVENIETRATFIKTYDGRRVVIPNSTLFTDSVVVNTAYPNRRIQYDFSINFSDDIERFRKLMLDAMGGVKGVLQEPAPEILVVEVGASGVNLRARWWVAPPRRTDIVHSSSAVLQAIKEAVSAEGIELSYSVTQVLLYDQTERDEEGTGQPEQLPASRDAVRSTPQIAAAKEQRGQDTPARRNADSEG